MPDERFLVTGALGCIGAWVVRALVQAGTPVFVFDQATDPHRLRLVLSSGELAQVGFITGDLADFPSVERAFGAAAPTHLIHLAALQVPHCKADPVRGALVNVVGTVNVFEAAKRAGLRQLVYASSFAVYGLSEEYPEAEIAPGAPLKPRTHYGVYKQANEGTARVYWLDEGLASLGLRPYIVYGPGRDQGLTSSPTKAMQAAATGQPYHIPFGGRSTYQYVADTAAAFIQAARAAPLRGAEVYNLPGAVAHMSEIVQAIETAAPEAHGKLSFTDTPLPFPPGSQDGGLENIIGPLPHTSLADGVAATIAHFRQAGPGASATSL
jgi:UDP-glucuronate 4-epimerase